MVKKMPIQEEAVQTDDGNIDHSDLSNQDEYADGKREYTVIRDYVNKYSGKHCPIGSRIFLTDERAAVLTELGCVALVPNRVIRRP